MRNPRICSGRNCAQRKAIYVTNLDGVPSLAEESCAFEARCLKPDVVESGAPCVGATDSCSTLVCDSILVTYNPLDFDAGKHFGRFTLREW
jgi:hypothetical protein